MSGRHRVPSQPPPRVLVAAVAGAVAAATVTIAVLAPKAAPAAPPASGPIIAAELPTPPRPTPVLRTTTPAPTTVPATTRAAPATTRPAPRTTRKPPPPAPAPPAPVACPSSGWGVRAHVARVGHHIATRFGLLASVIGGWRASSAVAGSDHPKGLALDISVGRLLGDRIAAYALERRAELGITYVIWRQRINYGSGWQPMADRGDDTANHFDHLHISLSPVAPVRAVTC